MDDTMITARLNAKKKAAGMKVLEKAGLNPSRAINLLYDKLIEEQNADFLMSHTPTAQEWKNAAQFIDALYIPIDSRFENMSCGEIKLGRAKAKGWI